MDYTVRVFLDIIIAAIAIGLAISVQSITAWWGELYYPLMISIAIICGIDLDYNIGEQLELFENVI